MSAMFGLVIRTPSNEFDCETETYQTLYSCQATQHGARKNNIVDLKGTCSMEVPCFVFLRAALEEFLCFKLLMCTPNAPLKRTTDGGRTALSNRE